MDAFLKTPNWYTLFSKYTFPTYFVKLSAEAVALLAAEPAPDANREGGAIAAGVIADLRKPLAKIPGNAFVSVDCCAPTDTERFAGKRGAVFSARSAWKYLTRSAKVRAAAAAGEVEYICLRPFRRISLPREFRLFIRNGELAAMSQYNLVRHYYRLDGLRRKYWKMADKFVTRISGRLAVSTLVMDIYITSGDEILVIDLNPWGAPTDPLLLKSWDRDWSTPTGLVLMDPPVKISGDVNVSF